jgi:hypothetical protein
MNTIIRNSLIVVTVFAGGVAAGKFSGPAKVVEKEHIVYQDKIVEKVVKVVDTKRKENRVYLKTVTISPDGTQKIETKIVNKDQIDTVDKSNTHKDENSTTTTDKEKTTTYARQSTIISLGMKSNLSTPLGTPVYGLFVNERIFGPLYMGTFLFTDKSFGLNAGIAF